MNNDISHGPDTGYSSKDFATGHAWYNTTPLSIERGGDGSASENDYDARLGGLIHGIIDLSDTHEDRDPVRSFVVHD